MADSINTANTPKKIAFCAYPSGPPEVTQPIRNAVDKYNSKNPNILLDSWEYNDVSGVPLTEPILQKISESSYILADITFLNENVAFEVGFAIGRKKRCLLFRNSTVEGDKSLLSSVGIFDTLGYTEYDNSSQLENLLENRENYDPIPFNQSINHQSPVYVIEPTKRDEAFGKLISRVKKARWQYRSFIPSENVRLSAFEAISHTVSSAGVICPLQPDGTVGQREHNIRAMFVAGIAFALGIPLLIIHPVHYHAPLDVRDMAKKFRYPDDIVDHIQAFSLDVTSYSQHSDTAAPDDPRLLGSLRIGDPAAENEMPTLSQYYLITDEYQRALRGEVNLVVGRKGSGKTALFVQMRDVKRKNKQNIVVDLKPEGYQLIKLKERVLEFLTGGAQQHLITAFWEYLLMLEIAYKVIEKDKMVHLRDHRLTELYQELHQIYGESDLSREGDFSERLAKLTESLSNDYQQEFSGQSNVNLTEGQLTSFLYKHDMKRLIEVLCNYLSYKGEIWLLFDNIDKGWNVEGVSDTDIFVLRCLIDASRKLERDFTRRDIELKSVIFVRDDVYTLLMGGSADYGKEMRAALDWSDKDLLGEMLKRRLAYSMGEEPDVSLSTVWNRIAVSHYAGDSALEHMIERSLMRPRNLLKIFRFSLGYAINFGHQRIEVGDIERGLRAYSQDLITEVNRELGDVFPAAEKLVYEFTEEGTDYSQEMLTLLVKVFGVHDDDVENVITYLLYYGLLGIRRGNESPTFIYDVEYNIELLRVRVRKWGTAIQYTLNPALWPVLGLNGS